MNTCEGGDLRAASHTVPLRNVFLHITSACNLRCAYCYIAAGTASDHELSTEEITRLWPQIVNVGPRKVVFTGGEPLLRPDLRALMEGLKHADPEHKVLRSLNTNGWLVNREVAKTLVGLVDEVRVSVDSLPETNRALRGEGSFEAAVRALHVLYSVGFEPIAMVTVSRRTLASLEDLLAFLVERRIARVHLNPFRSIGRGVAHPGWQVTTEEARRALDRAWKRIFPQVGPSERPLQESANCGVGSFLNILPEGDVYPCHVLATPEFRLGNVREQSLEELCAVGGRLARLQALDFRKLAAASAGWQPLSRAGSCLGAAYEQTRSAGAREVLHGFMRIGREGNT